ncbi:hypothetical protein NDU88_006101 [Pleurodeles waltl]|uniref:Uncharacterized protein n=1 Tax=Pleurodeles waltl TaxID=8319 RepID=A0AAV7W9N1_PLEWA|nr:hypothetical protein NDU88_006101 [Pleurodeles waltl]
MSWRGPVQLCLSQRALFSGACHGGALFSGACHGGALFSGACLGGALFSGACHGGALFSSACHGGALFSGACLGGALFSGACLGGALFSGACLGGALFSGACHGGALFSGACHGGALFSGACLVFPGNQIWPIITAQSPSDLSIAGSSCAGVLGPWVYSVTPEMGLVGPSWAARLLPDLSALLPLPSFAESLGPLPPFVDVPGDGARAAVSGLLRRPFPFLVLFPGGGLAVPLLLADVPALGAGGLQ